MQADSTIHSLIGRQREFFTTHATKDIVFRKRVLRLLYETVNRRMPDIAAALQADLHKCTMDVFTQEVGIGLREIAHTLRHLRRWMAPRRSASPLLLPLSSGYSICEPRGVALIIGPWNYPFHLVMHPLIGAVAAGNCVVVKPSETAPRTAGLVADLIGDCFEEQHVAVVHGGVDTVELLLEQQPDYCFFTGGTAGGKRVMELAARNLIPVTLELGGKCPCIVDAGSRLERAAARIVWGKFMNAGQTCIAPDYLLVHRSMEGRLLELMKEKIRAFFGDDPRLSPAFGRIIDRRHFDRCSRFLGDGTVVFGGETAADELYIAPTLLTGVTMESAVMREEIFGPVLPVLSFADTGEAVRIVNSLPKPLAVYLFSSSRSTARSVQRQTLSGSVVINDTVVQMTFGELPFGGVGASGMGCYHGSHSFVTFSHQRSIVENTTLFDIPRYPPYRPFQFKLMRMFFR